MAYKTIGILNILLGIIQTTFITIMFFFVMPKLALIYSQSTMDLSSYQLKAYLFGTVILLMGLINLFLGWKLFSKSKERFYKTAVISLVVTILLFGLLIGIMFTSVITPLYMLTTSTP